MRSLGYGKGYKYAHDYADGVTEQQCLPDALAGETFYEPVDRGYEKTIRERLAWWESMKKHSNAR
jgi:putative ATPase